MYELATDEEFALADRIEDALRGGAETPSTVARRAGCDTHHARRILNWMVRHQYARTSGNGGWTHYYYGREM